MKFCTISLVSDLLETGNIILFEIICENMDEDNSDGKSVQSDDTSILMSY
jgi:hypothetical protein